MAKRRGEKSTSGGSGRVEKALDENAANALVTEATGWLAGLINRKPIYRGLEFGEVGVSTYIMLTFSAGKLVAITAYPEDAPATGLVSKLGTGWRLAGDDLATDF